MDETIYVIFNAQFYFALEVWFSIVVIDYKSVASYEIWQFVTCRLCLRC